jgi:chemotaxis methyl-accepting protein methylase
VAGRQNTSYTNDNIPMKIQTVLDVLLTVTGKDYAIYSPAFLKATVQNRMKECGFSSFHDYAGLLSDDHQELDNLIDSFYVSYTHFFRNNLDMALFEELVLPELIRSKERHQEPSVRIWSAGCSNGPEAYSLAMLADARSVKSGITVPVMVFGTDISLKALAKARTASYDYETVKQVKLWYIEQYFLLRKAKFHVVDKIRQLVEFSFGDLTDPTFSSPPASIFADFDFISCCNLLIYYNPDTQLLVLEKLYQALVNKGYLQVGETERAIVQKFGRFRLLTPVGNIFIKN